MIYNCLVKFIHALNFPLVYYLFIILLDFQVFARDADIGSNSDLDYSIKGGKGAKGKNRFKIHPKTGQVYTTKGFVPDQTFDLMVSEILFDFYLHFQFCTLAVI